MTSSATSATPSLLAPVEVNTTDRSAEGRPSSGRALYVCEPWGAFLLQWEASCVTEPHVFLQGHSLEVFNAHRKGVRLWIGDHRDAHPLLVGPGCRIRLSGFSWWEPGPVEGEVVEEIHSACAGRGYRLFSHRSPSEARICADCGGEGVIRTVNGPPALRASLVDFVLD